MENKKTFRIADYNIGDYTCEGMADGSDEAAAAIREIMDSTKADVWATQTDIPFYGRKNGRPVKKVLFDKYKNYAGLGTWYYNYKAFITDLDVNGLERVYYTETDRRYSNGRSYCHPWFLTAEIMLGDTPVRFITLHVDWADNDARREQLRQILEFAKKFERVIILGDFNPFDYTDFKANSSALTYKEDLFPFVEAGFIPANAGKWGVFNTLPATEHPDPVPCDNILVSPNIKINKADTVIAPWMNDHAILYIDIEL